MYKILVIDDSFTNNLLIKDILTEKGFDVLTVEKGRTGIKIISKNFPDLVILDIMMPDIDGFSVLKEIRKIKKIPVIMLSATHKKSAMEKSYLLGAADYLTKPIIIEDLINSITNQLNSKKITV